jgi:hypothetical protein
MQRHLRHFTHRRHLHGWELGIVAIAIATLGVLLAVPLAVPAEDVPVPMVDGAVIAAALDRDRALASEIVPILEKELDRDGRGAELYDLRALGVAIRAYGKAEAAGDTYEVVRARQRLQEDVGRARAVGDAKLLALRAYQLEQFSRELARYEHTGAESDELIGLSGPFIALMNRYGWMRGRVVVMDDALRSTFWKRRWNEITGLVDQAFGPTLDEQRLFYAFLLQHPPGDLTPVKGNKAARRAENEWLLRKVDELARIDSAYPALLSRGVLLYRLERYGASADALRAHLASVDDPPYALRARNYLAAALTREAEQP